MLPTTLSLLSCSHADAVADVAADVAENPSRGVSIFPQPQLLIRQALATVKLRAWSAPTARGTSQTESNHVSVTYRILSPP
ncbi:unnamed protein product [Closterium sp. Yama58-4]|nr:unnamed protein product [Closterium sp. Yama58-4]